MSVKLRPDKSNGLSGVPYFHTLLISFQDAQLVLAVKSVDSP
jgi:hypothetical protein